MDLHELFDELDAGETVALADELADRLPPTEAATRILDAVDGIIAEKLLTEALS